MTKNLASFSVLTKKFQITLPKKIRQILEVKSGERIGFIVEGNEVKIVPLKSKLEENFGKVKVLRKPENFKEIRNFVEKEMAKNVIEELK
uniref:AbrB/MazE/SpoVT family DNA-binding domain-containing protein n=1 Tax=Thermodesulfobacterium geofontis TaxID=1295609 RepID=A0A7V5XGB0_9BACT